MNTLSVGALVVYLNNDPDYMLYEVVEVYASDMVLLKNPQDNVTKHEAWCKLNLASELEIKQGFRVLNPSNFTCEDKVYW